MIFSVALEREHGGRVDGRSHENAAFLIRTMNDVNGHEISLVIPHPLHQLVYEWTARFWEVFFRLQQERFCLCFRKFW